MSIRKLTLPDWFEATYPVNIHKAPVIGDIGKIAAIHQLDSDIAHQVKFDRGYTHLPILYENDIPADNRCLILLSNTFPGSGHSDAQLRSAAQYIKSRTSPKSCIGDQFCEGGSNAMPYEQYHTLGTKFYRFLCEEHGIAGAAQNSWYNTYDTNLTNFSSSFEVFGVSDSNPLHPYMVAALASQAGARKKASIRNGVQQNEAYYTSGMYQWVNNFTMMLWANDGDVKHHLFNGLFEIQRKYAADITAQTLIYTSIWTQSLGTAQNAQYKNPGWFHPRTGGHWLVPNWHIVPLEKMIQMGFFGNLMAEGFYAWEEGSHFTRDVNKDRSSQYVPPRTWKSEGGAAPTLLGSGSPKYPTYPKTGHDALIVGKNWYNEVKHIVQASTGLAYAGHSTDDGTYAVRPGDPRLFRRGFQNFGQDTILHRAAAEVGCGWACEGAGESLLVYVNPYSTETEDVTMHFNGRSHHLGELEGGHLHVFVDN